MGWPDLWDPGWGTLLLGPSALQGLAVAGVAPWGGAILEGHVQQGYCRRGEGRYRTWVEGVVMVGGKHSVQTLLVHPVFGGRALPWGILLVHPHP